MGKLLNMRSVFDRNVVMQSMTVLCVNKHEWQRRWEFSLNEFLDTLSIRDAPAMRHTTEVTGCKDPNIHS